MRALVHVVSINARVKLHVKRLLNVGPRKPWNSRCAASRVVQEAHLRRAPFTSNSDKVTLQAMVDCQGGSISGIFHARLYRGGDDGKGVAGALFTLA